jgi:hypothetical protein
MKEEKELYYYDFSRNKKSRENTKGNRESAMETGGKDPFLYFSRKEDRRKHSTNQSETT